jgi:hypothetical protein
MTMARLVVFNETPWALAGRHGMGRQDNLQYMVLSALETVPCARRCLACLLIEARAHGVVTHH